MLILLSLRGMSQDRLVPPGYHTYEEIIALADSLAESFPSICKKVVYGTSLGGRELAALKISDSVDLEQSEADILFDGGCHGDEVGGPENLIRFARDLCLRYGTDSVITGIVNNRETWLYLMVNPDGRVNMSRFNGAMVDVNRDYGYMWDATGGSSGAFSQPESRGVRQCLLDHRFPVYITYHSGLQQIAYPWAYRADEPPDKANMRRLAKLYADSSLYPSISFGQSYTIMYQTNGMSVDFNYGSLGQACFTVELSNDKQPPDPLTYYNINYPAMLEMANACGWGVEGYVTDSVTGAPLDATVWIDDDFPVYTDPGSGQFRKFLTVGYHSLKVAANGYRNSVVVPFNVPTEGSTSVNISLTPDSGWFAMRVMSCRIPDNNYSDEGNTPAALLAPDSIAYSIGKNGWVILDMGDSIITGDGYDITVYEAGPSDEFFQCFASGFPDGPWTILGDGFGTTGFDLGPLDNIRYLMIVDDGDGLALEPDAGYDLDAVSMLHAPGPWLSADETIAVRTLHVYPNPGSGLFRIDGKNITGGYLTVTDLTGRIVYEGPVLKHPFILDLTNLGTGIYRCSVRTSEGVVSASLLKTP